MGKLSDADRERINASLEYGAANFSEQDMDKVMEESGKAEEKATRLGDQFENFKLMWALLRDYRNGVYPNVPWKLVASIGFAVAYLIAPIDVVPDFIPILGFIDDATVFSLIVSAFQSEIRTYRQWKDLQDGEPRTNPK